MISLEEKYYTYLKIPKYNFYRGIFNNSNLALHKQVISIPFLQQITTEYKISAT